MKYIKQIGFAFASLTALSAGVVPSRVPEFNSELVGPFDGKSNVAMQIDIANVNENCVLKVKYYVLNTNALVINEQIALSKYFDGKIVKLNYNLQLKRRLTSSGLHIVFTLNNGEKDLIEHSINLYPKLVDSIDGFDYVYESYFIRDRAFQFVRTKIGGIYEEFNFKDTLDTLYITSNNELQLNEIHFKYVFSGPLVNGDINKFLRIKDKNNVYKNIQKDNDGFINIPLKLTCTSSEITIDYKEVMYCNPDNLDMSLTAIDGYEPTTVFKCSSNFFNAANDEYIYLSLGNCGINDLTVNLKILIGSNLKPIGMCYDSQYCFIGGIKE